jgi:hypothetical protein
MKFEIDTSKITNFIKNFHPKANAFTRLVSIISLFVGSIFLDMVLTKAIAAFFGVAVTAAPCAFFILFLIVMAFASVIVMTYDA